MQVSQHALGTVAEGKVTLRTASHCITWLTRRAKPSCTDAKKRLLLSPQRLRSVPLHHQQVLKGSAVNFKGLQCRFFFFYTVCNPAHLIAHNVGEQAEISNTASKKKIYPAGVFCCLHHSQHGSLNLQTALFIKKKNQNPNLCSSNKPLNTLKIYLLHAETRKIEFRLGYTSKDSLFKSIKSGSASTFTLNITVFCYLNAFIMKQ